MLIDITYPVAPRGLGESLTETELTLYYARRLRNRFINAAGGAEKRPGMAQLGADVPGLPTLDGLHELSKADGTFVLFVSGEGKIFKYDETAGTWSAVYTTLAASAAAGSVQMADKHIYYNGTDRNLFTKDGTTFKDLHAVIERGTTDTGTDSNSLHESDVTNWISDTNVAINDLVYNGTKNAYAIITAVTTSSAQHTVIGSAAVGAISFSTDNQVVGDDYEILDMVELNIVPGTLQDDNSAIAASGTTDNVVDVSAIADWTATDIRAGDWIRNTTRSGLGKVTVVSANAVNCTGVSGQTAGDSLLFFKSAMPIAQRAHIHFGRIYMIDARDRRYVRIGGPGNPEDMTTETGTLDSSSVIFGDQQPRGGGAVTMGSFHRFFVVAGRKDTLLYEGVDPIADTSGAATDFDIVSLFPRGVISPDAGLSIGNNWIFLDDDGLQSLALADDASTLNEKALSEPIRERLRQRLSAVDSSTVKMWHYQRRSWVCVKIGEEIFVFNYTGFLGEQPAGIEGKLNDDGGGSWSVFDGKFARQNAYMVRHNGDLVCCGPNGKVYKYDQNYDDDGEIYTTEYQTPWVTLDEPRRRARIKQGHYVKPVVAAGGNTTYTISVEAGFDQEAVDQIDVTVSGGSAAIGMAIVGQAQVGQSNVVNVKHPLRWRGEQSRFSFTTNDSVGPDVLSRFTVYGTAWGKR